MNTSSISVIAKAAAFAAVAGALAVGVAGTANAASDSTYGNPSASAQYWAKQHYDDCALMAAADVVGQLTGTEPAEEDIIAKAESTPSLAHSGSIYIKPVDPENANSGFGTSSSDLPTLLRQYNVDSVISDKSHASKTGIKAGIEGIEQALSAHQAVIVSLNGELIWHEPVKAKDSHGNTVSDHAVVVTGIDPVKRIVHLNDSGTPDGRDEKVSLDLFLKSWETSNERLVVTTGLHLNPIHTDES